MAVVLFALLVCLPAMAQAQAQERVAYVPFDAGLALPLTGGTLTGPLLLSDGTAAAPGMAFASQPGLGIWRIAADRIAFASGGTTWVDQWFGAFRILRNEGCFIIGASVDTSLCRDAAAAFQLGVDAATGSAYTLKAADSTGATIAGASLTLKGGAGTNGIANGGALILSGGAPNSTGAPGAVAISDGGTKPTCAAGIRGSIWYDAGGAGVLDTFEVCRKAADNSYLWVTLF
jgi:hypothetical protein